MTKLKYSTWKSRKHYKRWSIPAEKTEADSLRTLYGNTELRTILHWVSCHLLVEIEHRAYWVVKQCNLAYDQAGKQRKLQLQELDELYLEAYKNSRIYKQKLIIGKLYSRWDGPFVITNFFPMVNKHQIKLFHEGLAPTMGEMESISLMELAPPDNTPRRKPHDPLSHYKPKPENHD
ncbi:hypothetical protein CR513_08030, partial [Mucuna pruriens]